MATDNSKKQNDDLHLLKLQKGNEMNNNNILTKDEINKIVGDSKCENEASRIVETKLLLKKYDTNGDGVLSEEEVNIMINDVRTTDSVARYAGYSRSLAKIFRYLAFTSDFGEAMRPVVSSRIVTSAYAVSFGYCITDIAWEAYKLKERNYTIEKHGKIVPCSMPQLLTERSTFQLVASIIVPTIVIHTSVSTSQKFFKKIGKFTKWGPSIVGLSMIPLLPLYLDEPVEHALEHAFDNYGPWASKIKEHNS